jgi:hypothetical protein
VTEWIKVEHVHYQLIPEDGTVISCCPTTGRDWPYSSAALQQRLPAQQPGANPFAGEWTLTFDVNTPPGGVTLGDMSGSSSSPYHMVFHASKQSFQVAADGTFSWRKADDGSVTINGTYNYSGAPVMTYWATHQPLLKAAGTATATPTPPGSPQPYDRTLQVDLDWTGGNGTYGDSGGGGGAYIVDADGEQMTVTGLLTTTTLPVTYWQAQWSLQPARTVREEIGADETRETTTYEGSRQAEVPTMNMGTYTVTERIEVKHVRNLKLVPRG